MRLLVFSDLDGTLLDHETYSYEPALPALSALKKHDIPLVLATSKTAAEVATLHVALELGDTPAIVENGAGEYRAVLKSEGSKGPYQDIRDTLLSLRPGLADGFRGFGDMSAHDVSTVTGLSEDQATLAKTRAFSEPGLWQGSDEDMSAFIQALSGQGITARRGGRFLTLSHGQTKQQAAQRIAADFGADTTIALGDAPNDLEMIEGASFGVIIRNDHGNDLPHLSGEDTGHIRRTTQSGPEGWNIAILQLLKELGLE